MSATSQQIQRTAAVCAGGFIAVNAAFYVLSGSYFDAHHDVVAGVGTLASYSADHIAHTRAQFAVFTGSVALFGFLAGVWTRAIAHLIPALFGLVDLAGAVGAFSHHTPAVLGATLVIAGVLFPTLAWFSYRGHRASWAFLVAMCGVFGFVEVFGAPKVRDAMDVGLWTTMMLPGLKIVAVLALIALRGDYAEREPRLAVAVAASGA